MQTFAFGLRFRFDTAEYYETSFDMALPDEEIAFVKAWLKENGDMPFWAFEFENEPLFKRMMDAHIAAILAYVNPTCEHRRCRRNNQYNARIFHNCPYYTIF